MARTFARGEGGPPSIGAVDHDGRADHTELLDLADYTKKRRHKERMETIPKGFHMPGEKKADGVGHSSLPAYYHTRTRGCQHMLARFGAASAHRLVV